MLKMCLISPATLGGVLLSVALGVAHAAPTKWSVNDHWYDVVTTPDGINWDDAQAAAVASGGYLATLTTHAENAFAFALADAAPSAWLEVGGPFGEVSGPWLGGLQPGGSPEPFDNWTWTNGEGLFTTAGYNTNWISSSPNNFGGNENRNQFYGLNLQRSALWNDNSDTRLLNGYVVEWNAAPVPEPEALAMSLLGLACLGLMARRHAGASCQ